MNEAARMVEEGVASPEDIDKAVRTGFGIRYATMGFVEFTDYGGVDILYHAGNYLAEKLGPRDAFQADDFSGARLGQHGDSLVTGIEALRRLVYAFYDRDFSFARFLRRFPDCRDDLTHLLMGNVFRRQFNGLMGHLGEAMNLPPDYQPLRLSGEDD